MENTEELELTQELETTELTQQVEIPQVYYFSPETKEYLYSEQADKDNALSEKVGHFMPMVHAYSTLVEPPTIEENQIQVYSKTTEPHQEPYEVIDPETGESHTEYKTVTTVIENWNIEADYRKNFVKVDNNLNVSEIDTIGEQTDYIVVDKELGEQIEANPDMFKIVEGEVVKKSQKEYDKEQADKRKQIFLQDFFKVNNFGYYRKVPKGYQSAVESMNVLLNIANISKGIQAGLIIFYEEPDFTKPEQCTEEWLVEHQIIQPAMTLEQFKDLYVAFMTSWNTQEHN